MRRVASNCPATNESRCLSELQELVQNLPLHHRNSLQLLMHHLSRVAANSEENSMPPTNLGIVFGPTLLRTPEGNPSFNSLEDTVKQTKAIELLITNTKHLFPYSSAKSQPEVLQEPPEENTKILETSNVNSSIEVVLPGFVPDNSASTKEPLSSPEYDPNSSQGLL
jgi:hypothetical protein